MKKWKLGVSVVPIASAMILAGCGNANGGAAGNKGASAGLVANTTMTIACDTGSPTLTDNFNPLSPNTRAGVNWIYETLYAIDSQNGHQTPWLATSYKWNSSTELTFTIRDGIKWNDGKPFSATDVAYTFNLMKKYPALDANALWTVLKSVTAPNKNTVVFDFKSADIPAFTYICNTAILPEHIWKSVANPVTYTNTKPVGTGAFELQSFTPNQYVLKKNPNYWQASKVAVTQITFPAVTSNDTSDLDLSSGKDTWAQLFVPNIEQVYIKKDPQHNHYWFAPGGPSNLAMNLTKAPFNQTAFRQAMEYGINRDTVSTKGEYGYQPPADPTGLTLPGAKSWLDPSLANAYPYNPTKAQQLLASIGMKKNSKGQLIDKNGKVVQFNIDVPNGYTDWIQSCKVISQDLAKLGITLHVQTPSEEAWYNQLQTGDFDMSLTYGINYFDPWFYYDSTLSSNNTAPIGKPASSNFERWSNKTTDQLLTEYQSLSDPTQQKKIIYQLEKTMVDDVPVIPLFYNANWNEYSTANFVGWPDASNPYATPSLLMQDNEVIMTHLKLAH